MYGIKDSYSSKGGVTGRATHVISTPNSPVVKKMIEAIKRAEKIRPEQEKLYTIERGNRFATVARGVEASVKEKGKSGILPTMSDLAKISVHLQVSYQNTLLFL